MMKITGIIMTSAVVLLFGINKVCIFAEEKRELLNLIEMFKALKDLIENRGAVLKDAFEIICLRDNFKNFETAKNIKENLEADLSFEKSLDKALEVSGNFSEETKDTLKIISPVIGTAEIKTQAEAIESTVIRLEDIYENLRKEEKEKIPIIKALTVCGFFGAIIILI